MTKTNVSIISILIFALFNCKGQNTKASSTHIEHIQEKFQEYFNTSNYDEMYLLFNDKMKKRNTSKKYEAKLSNIKRGIGNIKMMEFINHKNRAYTYKATLEKGTLNFIFTIDDTNKLSAFAIESHTPENEVVLKRNSTKFILPFKNEWYVFWGGHTVSQNYHNAYASMYGAFDFWVMGSNGKSHRTDGKTNEDYFAFGQEIIAPCEGKIVSITRGIADNVWPEMNRGQPAGNNIIIETKNKEYIFFAHLKEGSITVKEGQMVKQGETIGLCGNSGLSTEPHLHFGLQNSNDLISAKGAMVYFEKILVNGELKKDYSPIKGDKISNYN